MASPIRTFFRLAFGLTWGFGVIGLLAGLSTSSPFYYLAGYSVSFAGIALTAWYDGRPGLRRLAQRLVPWSVPLYWYPAVVLGCALIASIAWRAAVWFGAITNAEVNWPLFFQGLGPAILADTGPAGEEFGWRGFALPRLLERYSPLKSALILGFFHTLWHLPLFFIPGMPQRSLSFPVFAVEVTSLAIFNTALHLRAGANLLLAILVHLLANVCGLALGPAGFPFFAFVGAVAAMAIMVAGGLKPSR